MGGGNSCPVTAAAAATTRCALCGQTETTSNSYFHSNLLAVLAVLAVLVVSP